MKFEDFVQALYDAGWNNNRGDAQHHNIKELHKRIFPTIAKLESDVEELEKELIRKTNKA